MAAHQCNVVPGKGLGQITALLDIRNQQIGVAESIRDVPDRDVGTDKAARMNDRAQRRTVGDSERQDFFGMGVHDGHDVGACLQDAAVDEPLEVKMTAFITDGIAFEIEFDDVIPGHEFGRQRTGHEERVRVLRITDADVTVGIANVFIGEDSIGDHEVINQALLFIHGLRSPAGLILCID